MKSGYVYSLLAKYSKRKPGAIRISPTERRELTLLIQTSGCPLADRFAGRMPGTAEPCDTVCYFVGAKPQYPKSKEQLGYPDEDGFFDDCDYSLVLWWRAEKRKRRQRRRGESDGKPA